MAHQCMDLAEYLQSAMWSAPFPQIGGAAADAWNYLSDAYYFQIPRTDRQRPPFRDLIVWDTNVGDGAGHIAICVETDETVSTSFDQASGRSAQLLPLPISRTPTTPCLAGSAPMVTTPFRADFITCTRRRGSSCGPGRR